MRHRSNGVEPCSAACESHLNRLGGIAPRTKLETMRSVVFGNTYLRNYTECPEGLYKYWMGHAGKDMSDLYDKIKEDVAFRRKWAGRCGFGFDLPSVVPNVPKTAEKAEAEKAGNQLREREKEWSGREDLNLRPPGPELGGAELILLVFSHLSGASTVSVLLNHASLGVM